MKFQYISDLHFEFFPVGLAINFVKRLKVCASNLVLAGDIFTYKSLDEEIVKILCNMYNHVFFVAGNHSYYSSSLMKMNNKMEEVFNNFDNWHWLDNSIIMVDGLKIAGSVLWFKHSKNTDLFQNSINDFSKIEHFKNWVFEENKKCMDFTKMCKADVMITHHLPSVMSVPSQFKNSNLNCFFVCDILNEMDASKRPAIWVHGHTHNSCDYMFDDTHVMCNPFGYYSFEENIDFGEGKAFEVII